MGDTRSGKTTCLKWLLEKTIGAGHCKTHVWFDLPKDSESLALTCFKPVNFIYPKDREVVIKLNNQTEYDPYEFVLTEMKNRLDIFDPWPYLREGWINVLCIEPFIVNPKFYGPMIAKTFEKLIYRAIHHDIVDVLDVSVDELNNVAPNARNAYNKEHLEGALTFQHNAERLAGHGIQLRASTQFYTELTFPTRKATSGLEFIKRGAIFPEYDEPRLAEASKHWQRLKPNQTVVRWMDHTYSETDITIPGSPDGCLFGQIDYKGEDITAAYFDEGLPKKKTECPCNDCWKPHKFQPPYVMCEEHGSIYKIDALTKAGCEKQEAKA